jgi:hypothetical protein
MAKPNEQKMAAEAVATGTSIYRYFENKYRLSVLILPQFFSEVSFSKCNRLLYGRESFTDTQVSASPVSFTSS